MTYMPIRGIASSMGLGTRGLITTILIPGLDGDIIPAFTSVTPDSTDQGFMMGSAEVSAARGECRTHASVRRPELHNHATAFPGFNSAISMRIR